MAICIAELHVPEVHADKWRSRRLREYQSDFNSDGTGLFFGWQVVAVLVMTCGTVFLMWLGEQIDEYGIGNGISLLIMAGILAQMPKALYELVRNMKTELTGLSRGQIGIETLVLLIVLFVGVVFGVVFITLGQRKIPTQSAKFTRGRRVYGGTRQFLPLRINQAGVMPIIFASSLLMIPGMLLGGLAGLFESGGFWFNSFNYMGLTLNDQRRLFSTCCMSFSSSSSAISGLRSLSTRKKCRTTFGTVVRSSPGIVRAREQRTILKRSWCESLMWVQLSCRSSQSCQQSFTALWEFPIPSPVFMVELDS